MSTDTQNGGQGATGTFGAVREQAESLVQKGVESINQSAAQVQANVRDTAQSYVDQAKSAAAGELHGVAQFVRNAVPSENAPPIVSQYANQAAESLDRLANSLQGQDLQSIMAAMNDFARRQPALFLGASVAVGFVAARFLRSQSPQGQSRYGAPASSLYPRQDFQHGHGATSPGLSGRSAAGGGSSTASSGGGSYGGGARSGQSGAGSTGHSGGGGSGGSGSSGYGSGTVSGSAVGRGSSGVSGSSSYGGAGARSGSQSGGSTSHGGGTGGSGMSGGTSPQGGGGATGGGAAGRGSTGSGGTASGGSADRSGSPVG